MFFAVWSDAKTSTIFYESAQETVLYSVAALAKDKTPLEAAPSAAHPKCQTPPKVELGRDHFALNSAVLKLLEIH